MKSTFIFIVLALLLCGCKPAARPAPPVSWEYEAFKYHDPDFRTLDNASVWCYYTEIDLAPGIGVVHSKSNLLSSVDRLLNLAGENGWELAWSDGTNFIVKRPADVWTNGDFGIFETQLPTGER